MCKINYSLNNFGVPTAIINYPINSHFTRAILNVYNTFV